MDSTPQLELWPQQALAAAGAAAPPLAPDAAEAAGWVSVSGAGGSGGAAVFCAQSPDAIKVWAIIAPMSTWVLIHPSAFLVRGCP
ncbi:MAG: hypothetical protein UZ16_OP3001000970 [Candidatus Hinthialibacteria bacterium OLB16]|nr:MAG: hypothetical protein UZ16_OP3001000970 [Candidatus Hinthialibacteria bacterium OLB16]